MFDGEHCRVHIRVRAESKIGQVVGIGGNLHALGYFQKAKVVTLVTTPESYPIWYTASPLVIPRQQILNYKYCIMENGVYKAFENLVNPRSFVGNDHDALIEDIFHCENTETFAADSEIDLLNELEAMKEKKETLSSKESPVNAGKLYIICYHLPVSVRRVEGQSKLFDITWSDSLIAKPMNDAEKVNLETVWIGTVHVPGPPLTPEETTVVVQLLKEMNCIPVFIPQDFADAAYLGYCKQVMWPTFHNVDPLDHIHAAWKVSEAHTPGGNRAVLWDSESAESWWLSYQTVNQSFANELMRHLTPTDVVWVHDYHLMLVPKMLRDKEKENSVVFFLHIPFPTSQVRVAPSDALTM